MVTKMEIIIKEMIMQMLMETTIMVITTEIKTEMKIKEMLTEIQMEKITLEITTEI